MAGDRGAVRGTSNTYANRAGPGSHVASASFVVDPAFAGRGVGRALCEDMLQWGDAQQRYGARDMKYIALIYGNEEIWSSVPPERWREIVDDVDAFNRRLEESGEMVAVDGLISRPRAVRAPDGVPVVSDGPYLEAKEHVGSYFILDVDSEERALEIVASYPALGVQGGGIELWPLMSGSSGAA